jgi:hypothetical protein
MVASCKISGGLRNLDCKILLIVCKLYIKHKKLIYIYIYIYVESVYFFQFSSYFGKKNIKFNLKIFEKIRRNNKLKSYLKKKKKREKQAQFIVMRSHFMFNEKNLLFKKILIFFNFILLFLLLSILFFKKEHVLSAIY